MVDSVDLRATRIASQSLTNDVGNLRRILDAAKAGGAEPEPEAKVWAFAGHQGRTVLIDRRDPGPPPSSTHANPTYTASSWKVGERATEIHPATGQHEYDTGNLYRTVHWKNDGFGLNGRFTSDLTRSGMWRNDGLNTNETRSKVLANPTQWGSPKEALSWM